MNSIKPIAVRAAARRLISTNVPCQAAIRSVAEIHRKGQASLFCPEPANRNLNPALQWCLRQAAGIIQEWLMLKIKWVIAIVLSVFFSTMGLAVENKGAEKLQIDGGSRGAVPFTHRTHQDRLGDCNVCHAMFPQESQSLAKLKESGQLKPKDVMNKLCVKCHKAEKNAGNKAGPTTCSQCHIK